MKKRTVLMLLVISLVSAGIILTTGCDKTPGKNSDGNVSDFPKETITLVVPYAAGGSADLTARIIAASASKHLNGVNIIVENVTGGSGMIALINVVNSKPDGYTLAYTPHTTLTVSGQLAEVPFRWTQLQPIIRVIDGPMCLAVGKESPFETFDDLVDFSKKNPGKLTFGISSKTSSGAIANYYMADKFNMDVEFVPHDGGGPLLAAILGGHVDAGTLNVGDIKSQIESGDLRVLVNLGKARNEDYYKDAPLITEIDPTFKMDASVSYGIFAHEDTPQEIIDILHDGFKATMDDPDVKERLNNMGNTLDYMGPEEYFDSLQEYYDVVNDVLKGMGLLD